MAPFPCCLVHAVRRHYLQGCHESGRFWVHYMDLFFRDREGGGYAERQVPTPSSDLDHLSPDAMQKCSANCNTPLSRMAMFLYTISTAKPCAALYTLQTSVDFTDCWSTGRHSQNTCIPPQNCTVDLQPSADLCRPHILAVPLRYTDDCVLACILSTVDLSTCRLFSQP